MIEKPKNGVSHPKKDLLKKRTPPKKENFSPSKYLANFFLEIFPQNFPTLPTKPFFFSSKIPPTNKIQTKNFSK